MELSFSHRMCAFTSFKSEYMQLSALLVIFANVHYSDPCIFLISLSLDWNVGMFASSIMIV